MELIDLKTLVERTSLKVFTLRKYAKQGMPHYRAGRKILVDVSEFDEWFKANHRVEQSVPSRDLDRIIAKVFAKFR